MKKLTTLLLALLCLLIAFTSNVNAQFTTSGGVTSTSDPVGIGTTSPAQQLHVVGNSFIDGALGIGADYTGNANNGLEIDKNAIIKGQLAIGTSVNSTTSYTPPATLYVTSWGNYPGVRFDGQLPCLLTTVGPQTDPIFQVRGLGVGAPPFGCSGVVKEHFNIMSGGYVGIGTSEPLSPLHVVGTITIENGDIFSRTEDGGNLTGAILKTSDDAPMVIWTSTNIQPFQFMFADPNTFAPTYFLKLNPNGNTGGTDPVPSVELIGRTNIGNGTNYILTGDHADYMLAVDGKVVAKRYITTQTAWADFVFAPNYKLPTLQDEINSITQNHTLVGVPSQADITSCGNDVGETQAILLMKIEELYLHVIELQKQLDALQSSK